MVGSTSVEEALSEGERALARGAWAEAHGWFDAVLGRGEDPAALEGLSWVHWWQGDLERCLAARERAYREHRSAGDRRGAARVALWIGDDHLWYRGSPALAEGWFARARRLLDGLAECPEHGWLAVFDAHVALDGGDLDAARTLAVEAQRLGRSHGVVGLEMFGVATEGMVRLEQGAHAAGLRCLDEATAAALAGDYEDLAPAAWSCCLLLSACEQVRDDERGAQWCPEILAFSRRVGAEFLSGNCRSYHGSVLTRAGRWAEAEDELVAAAGQLAGGPATLHRDALARLGELRRRQGRHEQARRSFEGAGEQWRAQAGLAALRLAEGDADGAAESIERALRQLAPASPRRADPLEVGVRIRLALGDLDAAAGHTETLAAMAEAVATRPLHAAALLCEARVAVASEDVHAAIRHYADAVATFERSGAPFEAAQARLEMAAALAAAARVRLAQEEARRAQAALEELGAASEVDRAAALLAGPAGDDPASTSGPLTPRQVEVLRLAAEGHTEREIAERLVLSEHTVHRHLANIYTRLGCSSRAAAVSQASRLGLL